MYCICPCFSLPNFHIGAFQQAFVTETVATAILYDVTWSEYGYGKTLKKELAPKKESKKGLKRLWFLMHNSPICILNFHFALDS